MPKIVDHPQRRAEITEALWSVIRRDGVGAASVRSVAAEAGWSTGAIRHYFSSQHELLSFAMVTLLERASTRVRAAAAGATNLEGVARMCDEVLPLDRTRRAESEVWLALTAIARPDPELTEVMVQSHRGLRSMCASVVAAVSVWSGRELDHELETDRLHGLIDGLAVHGTLYPGHLPGTRISRAVRAHLEELSR